MAPGICSEDHSDLGRASSMTQAEGFLFNSEGSMSPGFTAKASLFI